MSEDELERCVAEYLDRRAQDSELSPAEFAAAFGAAEANVREAIERALQLERVLGEAHAPPRAIGPYTVVRELGRGGMGVVYEVTRDGRRFALKLAGMAATAHTSSLQRFRREAQALSRLHHPGIVRIEAAGDDAGSAYIVMELLEGEALSRLPLPIETRTAVGWVAAMARAVAAAHAAGVVHRDLKPQNVMLVAERGPVVLDFGLAVGADDATLTESGAVLGTPRYMAPEQALGKPADERSDVHALGLILFELLFGRPARPAGSRSQVLRSAARNGVELPSRVEDPRGRELARILRAALARNPARRISSADELGHDLERWLAGEPVRARAPSAAARAWDELRRAPLATGLVACAVLAAFALALLQLRETPRQSALDHAQRHHELALVEASCGSTQSAERALTLADALSPGDSRTSDIRAWLAGKLAQSTRPQTSPRVDPLATVAWLRTLAPERALDECLVARREAPRSAVFAAIEADLRESLGQEAREAWRETVALVRQAPSPHWRLAECELRDGQLEPGVDYALLAATKFALLDVDWTNELPRLLRRAADPKRMKAFLRARAEGSGGDTRLWFALAWILDSDHELEDAIDAYGRVLDADSRHVRARLNLAHLRAGAQRGACADCDSAFRACATCFDPSAALEQLEAALAIDRGESEYAAGRIVQSALDLVRRAPQARAAERLMRAIDELAQQIPAASPAAVRLQDARLRLARAAQDR